MAKKLGYTWYPQNWNSSSRVFRLSLAERGFYRELIDRVYENNGKILIEYDIWSRMLGCDEAELAVMIEKFKSLKNLEGEPLVVVKGNTLMVPSCEPRLKNAETNRNNGGKGGRPKPEDKPKDDQPPKPPETPKGTQTITHSETQNETQTITETERQREYKEKEKENINGFLPAQNVDLSEEKGIVQLFRQPKVPSKREVWEAFSYRGGTKEMAKAFYDKYEALGWYLNSSPIVNFTNLVPNFVQRWKDNESKYSSGNMISEMDKQRTWK